jgi:hypothetical protein
MPESVFDGEREPDNEGVVADPVDGGTCLLYLDLPLPRTFTQVTFFFFYKILEASKQTVERRTSFDAFNRRRHKFFEKSFRNVIRLLKVLFRFRQKDLSTQNFFRLIDC